MHITGKLISLHTGSQPNEASTKYAIWKEKKRKEKTNSIQTEIEWEWAVKKIFEGDMKRVKILISMPCIQLNWINYAIVLRVMKVFWWVFKWKCTHQ